MHTLVDLRGNLLVLVYLTSASVNDVKALDNLYIEPSAIYLMDRGYVDFNSLFKLIIKKNAFFVTREKITCFLKLYLKPKLSRVLVSFLMNVSN